MRRTSGVRQMRERYSCHSAASWRRVSASAAGWPGAGRCGGGTASASAAPDPARASGRTTVNIMNETVKRPDSGTKHSTCAPSASSRSRMKSASMMKMEAAPVLPRRLRLLNQRLRGTCSPARRIRSSTTPENFSEE